MPRYCEDCDVDLPDMVTVKGMVGSSGVKYCPFCGAHIGPGGRDE